MPLLTNSKNYKIVEIILKISIGLFISAILFMPSFELLSSSYLSYNGYTLYNKMNVLMANLTIMPALSVIPAILLCGILRISFDENRLTAYRAFISVILVYTLLYFVLGLVIDSFLISSLLMLLGTILIIVAFWLKIDIESNK